MRLTGVLLAFGLYLASSLAATAAPQCIQSGDGFRDWLSAFAAEASARGVSNHALAAALNSISYDTRVIRLDRAQHVFRQSFEQFAGRMVNSARLSRGKALLQRNAALFRRIEARYGVPGPVLAAIWGLETDFGANAGKFPTIQALATLAADCRRSDKFTTELMAALVIIDRGEMRPEAMRGAWAGEIGQTQFMPSSYLKFAVDFDGDGRKDLIRSAPDVLASTANYLAQYGWARGQGWEPGQANFAVIQQWNASQVYSRTIAYFASRLAAGG